MKHWRTILLLFAFWATGLFGGYLHGKRVADHWYAEHEPRVQIVSTPERIVSQQLKIEAGQGTECKFVTESTENFTIRCYYIGAKQSTLQVCPECKKEPEYKMGWPAQTPIIPAGSNGSHGDLVPAPVVQ